MRTGFLGAMHTAINLATSFNAVTDYLAITMGTGRCQHINRAFEAVEGPGFSARDNLKGLVVIVSANSAFSHNASWLISTEFRLCAREWSPRPRDCRAGASPAIPKKDGDQEWSPYNSEPLTKYLPSYPPIAPSDNYPAD